MKKLFVLLCAFMPFLTAKSQGLGDYLEIDGVPGFVFYVDETGEHGLVMSRPALTDKVVKVAKKSGISVETIPDAEISEMPKDIYKKRKKLYSELSKKLSDDGEDNTAVVLEFCEDKGLSVKEYFPDFYWASNLGEGWFIPGKEELYKFAEFYLGGVGKEYKIKGVMSLSKRAKELSNNAVVQGMLSGCGFHGILSSSMVNEKNGFMGLIPYEQNGVLGNFGWFEFDAQATVDKVAMGLASIKQDVETRQNIQHVAIHKF